MGIKRHDVSGITGYWKEELKNDFETSVFARYPALAGIKEKLYGQGAVYAAMSGSGSAFFAIYRD